MGQADKVQDCVIRQTINVKLTAVRPIMEGDRDDAIDASMLIGRGLVAEAVRVLQMAAEREGFKVEIEVSSYAY